MQLTSIQVTPIIPPPENGLLAYVEVILDNQLMIHDIRIVKSPNRTILCMPNKAKTQRCSCGSKVPVVQQYCGDCGCAVQKDLGRRRDQMLDVVHPITASLREIFENEILQEYRESMRGITEGGV